MFTGTTPVRPDARPLARHHVQHPRQPLFKRLLSCWLALTLACTLTPSTAWANETGASLAAEIAAETEGPSAEERAGGLDSTAPEFTTADGAETSAMAGDAETTDEPNGSNSAGQVGGGTMQESSGVPDATESQAGSGDATSPREDEDTNDDADLSSQSAEAAPPTASTEPLAASTSATAQAAARAAITSRTFASISTSKKPTNSTGATGFIQTERTFYATAWTSRTASVPASGDWTYTWYASTDQSPASLDAEGVEVIEGETGNSITFTDELRTRLDGKYVLVKITDGNGAAAIGPRSSSTAISKLKGIGQVKAPVPAKTALDGKSYVLIQTSGATTSTFDTVDAGLVRPGDTLWANAWDSEAVPSKRIPHQERWSYQWLAGNTREGADADFAPIEGQTGPSLTLTDELAKQLAGKYLRVRIEGDGQTLYGPSGTFDKPASTKRNTPGPVAAPGQVAIGHIVLARNGEAFGDDYETSPRCTVGDTLQAAAYYLDYDTPTELYGGDAVDFSWQVANSANGPFAEVFRGEKFTVPADLGGRFLKVVATARNGVPGSDTCESQPGRILAAGQAELSSVRILNGSTGNPACGMTLRAQAYQEGDYWSETPVDDGVEVVYTWSWTEGNPSRGDFDESATPWRVIEGATGPTLTVSPSFEGCCIAVAATAGVNTVSTEDGYVSGAAGPFAAASEKPPAEEARFTASVKVTGAARETNGAITAQAWIPLTEYRWGAAGTTAWDAFRALLDEAGYFYDLNGGFPYSITTPDGATTLAMSANAPWKYWAFYVNGRYADRLAMSYLLQDGDVIELRYVDEGGAVTPPADEVPVNPDAAVEKLPVPWGGFANGGTGGALTDTALPTEGAQEQWTTSLLLAEERAAGAMASVSDPLIIGDALYVVAGASTFDSATGAMKASRARLAVIDRATGITERTVELARAMDSTCRPVYSEGVLVIPLAGGFLQAVSASSLETLWVAEGAQAGAQATSTLTVADGYAYVATADVMDANWAAAAGTVRRYNLRTGALAGSTVNGEAGYYWAGGLGVHGDENYFLMPDDRGSVTVHKGDLSAIVGSLKVSDGRVRTSLVRAGDAILAVSSDGVLHKLALAEDGTLRETGSVKFAAASTSTPAVANGVAYIGGSDAAYRGILAAINLDTLAVTTVTAADGTLLPAEVKSTPLVAVQPSGTYVYFTCNTTPGGLYAWKVGASEAFALHTPEGDAANWCMASPFAGPDGALYYTNDSGHLFALKATEKPAGPKPIDPGTTDPSTPPDPQPENPAAPETPSGFDKPTLPSEKPSSEKNNSGSPNRVPKTDGTAMKGFTPALRAPLSGSRTATAARPFGNAARSAAPASTGAAGTGETIANAGTPLAGVAESPDAGTSPASVPAAPGGEEGAVAVNPAAAVGLLAGIAGLAAALWILLRRRTEEEDA